MSGSISNPDPMGALRLRAAWLTFTGFLVGYLSIGAMFLADRTAAIAGSAAFDRPPPQGAGFYIFAGAALALLGLIYAAVASWLLFARWLFTRAEVEHVLGAGRGRTLDGRLARLLGPAR